MSTNGGSPSSSGSSAKSSLAEDLKTLVLKHKKVFIFGGVIALLFIVIAVGALTEDKKVNVPDLVDERGDAAKDTLKELGLKHDFESEGGDVWFASNWIVESSDPQAGEEVSKRSTVSLHMVRASDEEDASDHDADTDSQDEQEEEAEFDGTEEAETFRQAWLDYFGRSDDDSFKNIGDGGVLSSITEVTSPEEGRIVAHLTMSTEEVDEDEANALAVSQLNILSSESDDVKELGIEFLEFESDDGDIVGTNDEKAHRSETDAGLTPRAAEGACRVKAKQEFPYGAKLHWIKGKLAEDIRKDSVFFKVEATITNEFGTKEKGKVVECEVEGTDDAPHISSFRSY